MRVAPHEIFQRAGDDLACEITVPMTVAALGGSATVPTIDGSEEIDVAAGTQSGHVVRLRGKGMPRLGGRGRGELVGVLKIETPQNLSTEESELLERFAALRGEATGERGFFDKIKEAFN
jgi:molecular chaperone DnaJ